MISSTKPIKAFNMKTFITTLIAVAVPALFATVPMRGEESSASTSLSATEDALKATRIEAERVQAEAQMAQMQAEKLFRQAREQMSQSRVQIAQAESGYQYQPPQGAVGGTISGSSSGSGQQGGGPAQFSERLTQIIQRATPGYSGGPGRTLVVRSGDGDPAAQAALEEDLAVMSHIFDKAIIEKVGGGNRERTAMGINVYFGPNADTIRNLYLDGYGALFTLKVNFPLLAPPKVNEEQKEKPAAASEWDEAKRELYSREEGSGMMRTVPPRTLRYPGSSEAVEEFSEQKVTQLKDALLESLKSATNIRSLKPDDSITLCVFGGPGTPQFVYRAGSAVRSVPVVPPPAGVPGAGVAVPQTVDPATGLPQAPSLPVRTSRGDGMPARGSILTVRVKKSDVDSFAKGKLDLDQFRKKASLTIYPSGSDGGNAAQRWEMY
jgi:hypothetical protein